MYSMSFRSSALLAALFLGAAVRPATLHGQLSAAKTNGDAGVTSSTTLTPGPVDGAAPSSSAGPRVAPAGITRPVLANPLGVAQPGNDTHVGVGSNLAMIGAGAAAVVVGLMIGGNGGTLVALSGGVIGLIGFYRYLR